MENGTANRKPGFNKVAEFCAQAFLDGFEYAWVDSCCIDQSSSAEISEAINSMFNWYRNASMCYAYLEDMPSFCEEPFSIAGNAQAYSRVVFSRMGECSSARLPRKTLTWGTTDLAKINCSFSCQVLCSKLGIYWGPSVSLRRDYPNHTLTLLDSFVTASLSSAPLTHFPLPSVCLGLLDEKQRGRKISLTV